MLECKQNILLQKPTKAPQGGSPNFGKKYYKSLIALLNGGRKRGGGESCRHLEIDKMIMNTNQVFFRGGWGEEEGRWGGERSTAGIQDKEERGGKGSQSTNSLI